MIAKADEILNELMLKDLTIEQIGNFDCEHTECHECPFYPIRFDIDYKDTGCIVNYLS